MEKIQLRKCSDKDCKYIYKLANDEVYRRNSFNPEFIEYETHKIWFSNSMKNKNRMIYIVSYENKNIGEIIVDIIDCKLGEISYVLESNYRGRGIGSKVLELIKRIIIDNFFEIKALVGKVKEENIPSRKAFLKNGYLEIKTENFYKYTLKIER